MWFPVWLALIWIFWKREWMEMQVNFFIGSYHFKNLCTLINITNKDSKIVNSVKYMIDLLQTEGKPLYISL